MGIADRIRMVLGRGGGQVSQPRPGQIVRASPQDTWRDYPADGLTPGRLAGILKAADAGDLQAAMDLYEQMEEKDAHLFCVANTRRLALTGLPWQVVSAADVADGIDRRLADEAASYCREVLVGLEDFDEALQHLSLALGRNVAAAELVWDMQGDAHRLVGVVPVPFGRLSADEFGKLRIATGQDLTEDAALPPNKFVVHTPHALSGHPARGGLLRVTAMAFLGKHYALKDWLIFSEVFGMPVRIARYEPQATPQEKREMPSGSSARRSSWRSRSRSNRPAARRTKRSAISSTARSARRGSARRLRRTPPAARGRSRRPRFTSGCARTCGRTTSARKAGRSANTCCGRWCS
jgi:phage gp29-like protein